MVKNNKAQVKNKSEAKSLIKYPQEILRPIKDYLNSKLFGLEKQRKVISAADPIKDKSRLVDNAAIDDDAAEQVGHLQANAFKSTLDRRMIQIRKALSQIKVGKYGVCESCGKMIDTDRLMIMPETTVCIDCERSKEK